MRFFLLFAALLPALFAQEATTGDWATRTIQLKYLDPEQLRDMYSGRSFVMQVNRELKLLTVSGPAQFLNEVEQMGKKLDVPPAAPADIEFTVYLLSNEAAGAGVPSEIQAPLTVLEPNGARGLRLVDLKTIRTTEGQPGEVRLSAGGGTSTAFGRITFQAATVIPGPKKEMVRLAGLRVWITQPQTQVSTTAADSDFVSNVDLKDGQAEILMRSGVSKPVLVMVRASISR